MDAVRCCVKKKKKKSNLLCVCMSMVFHVAFSHYALSALTAGPQAAAGTLTEV